MTLEELLDHLATNELDDRAELVNGPSDSLWSDEVLVRYLNAGQELFCRKAWAIEDDTTQACCEITLLAGIDKYPLHKSVMRVLSVTPADTSIPLVSLDFSLISPQPVTSLPDFYQTPPQPFIYQPGRPGWYSTDEATRVLRLRPAPDADAVTAIGTLNLRVARLPVVPLDVATPSGTPEIPEEYHLELCSYAAGRALSQANVDSLDAQAQGKQMVSDFETKIRKAKNDRLIAMMQPGRYLPGTTVRTSKY